MVCTSLEKAICQLFTGTFFFAKCSCKCLQVSGSHHTKIIMLNNVRFFKGRKELSHNDRPLYSADTVSINYENQKKDTWNDTVTHFHSGHKTICPVLVWSSFVKRIRAYPKSNDNTSVNTFMIVATKCTKLLASKC